MSVCSGGGSAEVKHGALPHPKAISGEGSALPRERKARLARRERRGAAWPSRWRRSPTRHVIRVGKRPQQFRRQRDLVLPAARTEAPRKSRTGTAGEVAQASRGEDHECNRDPARAGGHSVNPVGVIARPVVRAGDAGEQPPGHVCA